MTPFEWVLIIAAVLIAGSIISGLVLIVTTKDPLTRAVLSDLAFYGMTCLYLVWTLNNQTSIAYDIMILAALAGGVLPTLSMSRIISRGRR